MLSKIRLNTLRFLILLLGLLAITITLSFSRPIYMDEYFFWRLSKEFPNYDADPDWMWEHPDVAKAVENTPLEWRTPESFAKSWEGPIRTHPPAPNILMYPFANMTENIHCLRIISTIIFGTIMCTVYLLLRRKIGRLAMLCVIPAYMSYGLLGGVIWFYREIFMHLFFFLTLYLLETKPKSKLPYLTAVLMVNTKTLLGIIFLFPLMFLKKRIGLAALSFIPYYLWTCLVTNDPLYLYNHWVGQSALAKLHFETWVLPNMLALLTSWNLFPFVPITLGCLFLAKKYPTYTSFYILSLYGFLWGWIIYQTSAILYSAALILPLLAHWLRNVGTRKNCIACCP